MPSLSIDHPHHHSPSPTHGHASSSSSQHSAHRMNRYRRPHHLRIQSPPKSPLIFSAHHHHLGHDSKVLLTPEIVYSQQTQNQSPWKGTIPATASSTTPSVIIPTTAAGLFGATTHRADSSMSIPKISVDSYGHSSAGSTVGGGGGIPFTFSQQNFLQRLHLEKLQQSQTNLQSSSKNSLIHSRNDDQSFINSQFYPEEISLMRMDEDFAIFNTEIDFTQPDPSRPLQIRVSGRSIYVDPQFAQDLSPIFTNFLARELVAGKRKCVEMQREDISFPEVLEMAKVLCPYELGMFPKPVEASTFCSLSRISKKFKVANLKLACELFVARMSLEDPKISSDELCTFLVSSYHDGLSNATKIRLLEALISRGISTIDRRTCKIPGLAELIREAAAKYRLNEFMHSDLLNDARLRVPCRTCRIEQPNVPLPAIKGELSNTGIPAFVVCSKCRSTICCGCVLKPCKKAIEEFVQKFSERYNST